ncbi:MAG: hypothetical protein DYG89_00205 [Caldilinea sp. CFX5]|nr:hypothetical protein [Caldilinea sp. CFX5]
MWLNKFMSAWSTPVGGWICVPCHLIELAARCGEITLVTHFLVYLYSNVHTHARNKVSTIWTEKSLDLDSGRLA